MPAADAAPAVLGVTSEQPQPIPAIRLGSLVPGNEALPVAVVGHIVVGNATVRHEDVLVGADGAQWTETYDHAVMWNLSDPRPAAHDLGALGKEQSHVTGFDGRWVVGTAETYSTDRRAFAVDLAADHPRMIDLGTLGGAVSQADAVDDGVVVGTAATDDGMHAFAMDLKASSPRMLDLGDLGGDSAATAVRDGLVAGTATSSADGTAHAFAVDLRSSDSTMRDLGSLGASYGIGPTAVERPVVVGTTSTTSVDGASRHVHAFAVDLEDRAASMRDISSGDPVSDSTPTDIENGIAVGTEVHESPDGTMETSGFAYDAQSHARHRVLLGTQAQLFDVDASGTALGTTSDGGEHAITFDASTAAPTMVDRGLLAGDDTTTNASDDRIVLGTLLVSDRGGYFGPLRAAAAWPVGNTIGVRDAAIAVSESVGTARIRVVRTGDLSAPATVHYRTVPVSARTKQDFAGVQGTARFAAGQGVTTIRVPIHDDARSEQTERFTLQLSHPSTGQHLLGNHITVAIRTSDQRPDAEVSRSGHGYVGNDVYNTSARHQTVTRSIHPGKTSSFSMRLGNDGNSAILVDVQPRGRHKGLAVRYFQGKTNLTSAVEHGGWQPLLRPGHTMVLRIEVSARRSARPGTVRTAKVGVMWRGDHTWQDVVGARVRIRP